MIEGRLQQATLNLLAGSDIQFRRETRLDIALVKNHELALVFLPAADIPTFVGEGRVDLGITGRDQVAEHEATSPSTDYSGVEEVLDLDFGKCKLQVQVPENGSVKDAKELVGKTVVTSFTGLTYQYFAKLEGHTLAEGFANEGQRPKLQTKIMYVGGSVEAACALGVADGIVDLVGEYPYEESHQQTAAINAAYRIGRDHESCRPKSNRHSRNKYSSPNKIQTPIQPKTRRQNRF